VNRNEIIIYLTNVKYIKNACLIAGDLADDLFQHIWVKILEMDFQKIESIQQKGFLDFYIMRMIKNEATNPNNPFLKTIKFISSSPYKEIPIEEYDKELDIEFETNCKIVKEKLETLFWYDKGIFELYLKLGSLRKVEKETGIKYGAIHQTVNKVKRQLNESITNRF